MRGRVFEGGPYSKGCLIKELRQLIFLGYYIYLEGH